MAVTSLKRPLAVGTTWKGSERDMATCEREKRGTKPLPRDLPYPRETALIFMWRIVLWDIITFLLAPSPNSWETKPAAPALWGMGGGRLRLTIQGSVQCVQKWTHLFHAWHFFCFPRLGKCIILSCASLSACRSSHLFLHFAVQIRVFFSLALYQSPGSNSGHLCYSLIFQLGLALVGPIGYV